MKDLPTLYERDKQRAAHHEAGHLVAAHHFRIMAFADIWPYTKKPIVGEYSWGGRVRSCGKRSKFRFAVMCWAGPLAEAMMREPESLTDLPCWYDEFMDFSIDEISESDRAGILGHPMRWRACKTAMYIITRRLKEWREYVRELLVWNAAQHLPGIEQAQVVDTKSPIRASRADGSTRQRVEKMLRGVPWRKRLPGPRAFGNYHRRGWFEERREPCHSDF